MRFLRSISIDITTQKVQCIRKHIYGDDDGDGSGDGSNGDDDGDDDDSDGGKWVMVMQTIMVIET